VLQISRKAIVRKVVPDTIGQNGEWPLGVYAQVEIWVPIGGGTSVRQTLSSGGLWDIDASGPDDPYVDDVYAEELKQLETIIQACGFTLTD
jgi:hypothetical protein